MAARPRKHFSRRCLLASAVSLACFAIAAPAKSQNAIPLSQAIDNALQQSKLTLPGSKPFHLKAEIVETTNPSSGYRANIEEQWESAEQWRRTIESPSFSQTIIVNGDKVSEKDTGDYFPWWLNDLVTAMVDPLPMAGVLRQANARIRQPGGGENSNTCAYLPTKIDRWVVCFEGSHGLFASVLARGFDAQFKDYKGFAGKRIARTLVIDPEPGTTIEAQVTRLEELRQPDDKLFAVEETTPRRDRIQSVQISSETLKGMAVNSTEIAWPSVGEGLTKGGCAVYVSADRLGKVREVWPHGCDNAGLEDPLREIVKKWQLKPAITKDGTPVQVESLVTFSFDTATDKSKALPDLSDEEVRKLAKSTVEPRFPAGTPESGKDVTIQISVDETGKFTGAKNTQNISNAAFLAAYAAVRKWEFRPYVIDGKPQYFHGNPKFHVP